MFRFKGTNRLLNQNKSYIEIIAKLTELHWLFVGLIIFAIV